MLRKSCAALLLAAAVSAFSASLDTARGPVEIEKTPERIAVYDPGLIDTLTALEVKIAGIPDFNTEMQPEAVKVGTLFEPDLEALAALNPDLIMVAVRSASKFDAVSRVAQTVDLTLENKNAYEQAIARLHSLGALFGKEEQAKAWEEKLNALRDETKALAEGQGKVLAVIVNGPKLSIYGKDSRIGWIEPTLGLELLDKEKTTQGHGNPISFEYIAEVNPDWIFVIDRAAAIGDESLASAQTVLDTPLVQKTTAGEKGQIVYLSPREIYVSVGGPQALEATLVQIRDALKTARP